MKELFYDTPVERCAVYGAVTKGETAAEESYYGLYAQQHRGQEASGIAAVTRDGIVVRGKAGLVSQAYTQADITALQSSLAIGHNLYTTSESKNGIHIQPRIDQELQVAFAFNGNIPDLTVLNAFAEKQRIELSAHNDTELMFAALCWLLHKRGDVVKALEECWHIWNGAFSVALLTQQAVYGYRGHYGIRPLVMGRSDHANYLASESCAFDHTVHTLTQVAPGHIVELSREGGVRTHQVAVSPEKMDVFELVYFARPDSQLFGQDVYSMRRRMGQQFAREHTLPVDMVVPVPDSAIPAAEGFAAESGIDLRLVLLKNRYIHRTFIQPSQQMREAALRHKLSLIAGEVRGKRVLVLDDSIVRGTTAIPIIKLFRQAGAAAVYFGSASPPLLYPDFYGIATPSQSELIAAHYSPQEIAARIGADGVYYLSYRGLMAALQVPEEHLNTSCFTGEYPIDIGIHSKKIRRTK